MNVEEIYEATVGEKALERQRAKSENCPYCWAEPNRPHTNLCPNRPEDEDPASPEQDEALF